MLHLLQSQNAEATVWENSIHAEGRTSQTWEKALLLKTNLQEVVLHKDRVILDISLVIL